MTKPNSVTAQLRPLPGVARWRLFAGCAALALSAAPALAQTPAAAPAAADSEKGDTVVITGSRLRGVDQPVGSPVLAIDNEQIELATTTSIDKLIQQTPQIFDLGVSEGSRGQNGGSSNIVYGTGINLRGLGPYSTLVLVDGHRAITNGRSIDPSFLPSLGLERIEVLADGASAVYGSDAVAGVVNLIPIRGVNGASFYARYGVGDSYDENNVGLALGKTWDAGQVHFAYEHGYRSNVNGADRDFFRANQVGEGGPDYRPTTCNPGNIVIGGVSYAIPTGGVTTANRGSLAAGTTNKCETLELQDLLPEQEYNSFSMTFNQHINNWLEFVADGFHTERDFYRIVAPGTANLNVPSTNAFFVAPTGLTPTSETIQYQFGQDFPGVSTNGFAKNWEVTGGLVAKLPYDWRAEAMITYGENYDNSESYNGVNNTALNAALASSDPNLAFDPYGLNRTQKSVIAGIANQIFLAPTKNELTGYDLRVDGPLFALPAGEVRLAAGLERQEQDTHLGSARGNPGTPIVYRNFGRDVNSGYLELFVPLFSDKNGMPGLRRLEFNIAGRYDDYSDVGHTTNPKYGVNWSPINDLTIRGSYAEAFRAPIFSELYGNSSALFVQAYSDPTANNASVQGVALSGGNTGLAPEQSKTKSAGFEWRPSAAPHAKIGATWFDIDYTGQITAYLSDLTILRNETQFAGTNIILRGAAAAQRVADLRAGGTPIGAGVLPNPVTLFVDGRPQNLGKSHMEGFDFTAAYSFPLLGGDLDVGLDGTYLTKFDIAITPNGIIRDKLDRIFNPFDYKARATAVWRSADGDWKINGALNYVGEYINDLVAPTQNVGAWTTLDLGIAFTPGGDEAKPIMQGGFTIGLDVRNVFDEDPPYVNLAPNANGSGGYDATAANPTGRVVGLSVRKHW